MRGRDVTEGPVKVPRRDRPHDKEERVVVAVTVAAATATTCCPAATDVGAAAAASASILLRPSPRPLPPLGEDVADGEHRCLANKGAEVCAAPPFRPLPHTPQLLPAHLARDGGEQRTDDLDSLPKGRKRALDPPVEAAEEGVVDVLRAVRRRHHDEGGEAGWEVGEEEEELVEEAARAEVVEAGVA